MRIKVMKFGGTSVATQELRTLAARKVVQAKEQGFAPVVVVSAIGRQGAPYATDTLLNLLHEVDPLVTPDPREVDLMLCCGEIMSTCIFAQTLKSLGHPASAMTGGQAGLVTDTNFGNARILEIHPDGVLKVLSAGRIPVVCGFQGRSKPTPDAVYGEITTLGRGGSDTTASALGAALNAEAIEIYTDVDGVKTADPTFVPEAPTLREMTYDEVAEIAHQGGKVVHPRAAEIAMKFNIPLYVKCTHTDQPGTFVHGRGDFPGRDVTAVTHTGKLVYIHFHAPIGPDRPYLEATVYRLIADNHINLFMLNAQEEGFAFAVPRRQMQRLKEILDGLVLPFLAHTPTPLPLGIPGSANPPGEYPKVPKERPNIHHTYIFQIGRAESTEVRAQIKTLSGLGSFGEIRRCIASLTENVMMISLIAFKGLCSPGVYARIFRALERGNVQVLQTSDSRWAVSVLVSEADGPRAVRLLFNEFELHKVPGASQNP
jgi:aspartate kinase